MDTVVSSQAECAQREQVILGRIAKAMPFVLSSLFHVGLFLVMIFAIFITGTTTTDSTYEVPIGIVTGDPPPEFQDPLATKTPKTASLLRPSRRKTDTVKPAAATGVTAKPLEQLIGTDGATTGSDGSPLLGPPTGLRDSGPFPITRTATNVVYVVDCSGSMIDTFDSVRMEMARSIGRHRYDVRGPKAKRVKQYFHVILFTEGKPHEPRARRLVPATQAGKRETIAFLQEARPERQTDPIPALKRAFEVLKKAPAGPSVIYLLTDGEFPDPAAVHRYLASANAGRKVHIHTTLYAFRDLAAQETLERIAKDHGGRFNYVAHEE